VKSRKSRGSNARAASNGKKAAKNGQSAKPPVGKPNRLMSSGNSENGSSPGEATDRLSVQVLDSHWLHVVWSLSHHIIDRARVALGMEWHQAVPVLRVLDISEDEISSGAITWVKDIEVFGNVDHWYVPVEAASCTYKLQIGFRTAGGNFFTLARSNTITMPLENSPATTQPELNGRDSSRKNGSKHADCSDHNRKLDEEIPFPLQQPGSFSNSIEAKENDSDHYKTRNDFQITFQTELVIHGRAHPDSELTCLGNSISLDEGGRFSLRLAFPEGRQVIPIAAVTPDGKEKYTTVLGIMRNTKELGPQSMEEPLL
jgi:hypothetical protein